MAEEGTPIGALAVRIGADATDLIDGFKKAGKATHDLERAVNVAAGTIAAAGAALLTMAVSATKTADDLGKMSQKVGIAVDQLSALTYAARLSNVSTEQLGTGLKQLSKFMVDNQITGVSVQEQLLRIADEMQALGPGAEATARAMEYFGKSGADLLPMLFEGRTGIARYAEEAKRFGLIVTEDAAKGAQEFQDNLSRLGGVQAGTANTMMTALLPAMTAVTQELVRMAAQTQGFLPLAEAAKVVFETIAVLGANVAFVLKGVGTEIGGIAAQLAALATGDFKAFSEIGRLMKEDAERARQELDEFEKRIFGTAKKVPEIVRAAQGDIRRIDNSILGEGTSGATQEDQPVGDEMVGRQLQEALEEEIRIQAEAAQAADEFRAREREAEAAHQEAMRAMREQELENERQLQEEITKVIIAERDKQIDAERKAAHEREAGARTVMGHMASLMNTESKKLFEIGKVAALAEAGIKGAQSVMNAYEWGTKFGGPVGGAVAAGAAALATANMINNIRAQQFGGGAGAPTPVGQGSSGVGTAAAPAAASGSSRGSLDQTIFVQGISDGELFSGSRVRALIETLQEAQRNGARVFLAS